MKRLALLLLAGCTWAPATFADNAALQRCRELRDTTARLACYDAIPLSITSAPPLSQPPAPAATTTAPAATFGLESRQAPPNMPAPLEAIESTIDGAFDGWLPRSQLKLANGQVWEIADGSQAAYRLQSPKVKITRGVSSSFFMAVEGVAQTPRVRRVK
jgi:hypothetical protein